MAHQQALELRLPAITLSCACVSLVAYVWPDLLDLLVYDRQAILTGELWRLGTAIFVHFSLSHMLWDLLVFAAAGCVIEARGYRGFMIVCSLTAIVPGMYLLLASPEFIRYGGLSGLATAAVTYLCLCEMPAAGRYRILWLAILALVGMKIAVETVSHTPIFAGGSSVNFQVLPSVHAIGCAVAIAVYGTIRPNQRLEPTSLRSAAQA